MKNKITMGFVLVMSLGLSACVSVEKQAERAAEQANQIAQQAQQAAAQATDRRSITTPSHDSGVYIIFFEQDKKDKVLNAINHYQDEVIYDYKNLGGMMAIKITADDVAERAKSYRQIDGVRQLTKSQTMQLH